MKQFSRHLVPAILWAAEYAIKEQMEREKNPSDRAHGSDDGSSCRVTFTSKSAERRRSRHRSTAGVHRVVLNEHVARGKVAGDRRHWLGRDDHGGPIPRFFAMT